MKTINMQHEANIKAKGMKSGGLCKPIICIETGEVFTSITDAADQNGVTQSAVSQHLTGRVRSVKGKHYFYLSRANENLDAIVTRLREASAIEEDAKKWKAYEAEQTAIRLAEEKRAEEARIAQAKHEAAIAIADAKVERCKETYDRIAAQLKEAEKKLMAAEMEREALDDVLEAV